MFLIRFLSSEPISVKEYNYMDVRTQHSPSIGNSLRRTFFTELKEMDVCAIEAVLLTDTGIHSRSNKKGKNIFTGRFYD